MRELLEFLLLSIAGKNNFTIEEENDDEKTVFNITAEKDIMGLLIGKEGQTIKAIQNILRVKGRLEQKNVFINIQEKGVSS